MNGSRQIGTGASVGKRVLQLIGSFHQGGSERQAVQLSLLLKRDGEFDVTLATLDKRGSLLDEAHAGGFTDIPEYRLKSFVRFGFVRRLFECASYMRKQKFDIVHTHDFYTNVFGILAARLAGVPVRIASKRETKGVRTPAQEKAERIIYRISTAITVNSKAVGRFLEERGVESSKIRLVYNGLDTSRLEPGTSDREVICEKLGIPPDKVFVTIVANLRHGVKNQPMLLRCAKYLRDDFPDVHFVFAGEGERKDFLTDLSVRLGVEKNVHFIDRCKEVGELLYVSEVCVLTSYAEGFSNSILEYMAAAKPVVATDVGGARECVEDGATGYLVPSDDAREMADRLASLLSDPEKAAMMGQYGKTRVRERFDSSIQLANIKNLYEDLTEGRKRPKSSDQPR